MKRQMLIPIVLLLLSLIGIDAAAQSRSGSAESKSKQKTESRIAQREVLIAIVFRGSGDARDKKRRGNPDTARIGKDSTWIIKVKPYEKPRADLDSLLKKAREAACKNIEPLVEGVGTIDSFFDVWYSISLSDASGDEIAVESVSINYSAVKWQYAGGTKKDNLCTALEVAMDPKAWATMP